MPRSFLFLATALLLFAGWRCGNQAAGPAPPPPSQPDTTSHDFTWTTYTLGDGQSYLQDVYVASDTDVWAVGEIYLKDSTGKLDLKMYNAAHWDGKIWKPQRIFWHYQGQEGITALNAVFGFSSNDIWVAPAPKHWDGATWTSYIVSGIPAATTTRIWGYSSTDLYFVGTNGSIMHYIPWIFQKMESGTNLTLTGVCGNSTEIWAVGGSIGSNKSVRLRWDGTRWVNMDSLISPIQESTRGVWLDARGSLPGGFIGFAGYGVVYCDTTWKLLPDGITGGLLPGSGVYQAIRGNARNDIFAAGHYGAFIHYNGRTWHCFTELIRYPSDRLFMSISVTKNMVVAVGDENDKGFAVIGVRR